MPTHARHSKRKHSKRNLGVMATIGLTVIIVMIFLDLHPFTNPTVNLPPPTCSNSPLYSYVTEHADLRFYNYTVLEVLSQSDEFTGEYQNQLKWSTIVMPLHMGKLPLLNGTKNVIPSIGTKPFNMTAGDNMYGLYFIFQTERQVLVVYRCSY